jgi:hypothetical protein
MLKLVLNPVIGGIIFEQDIYSKNDILNQEKIF